MKFVWCVLITLCLLRPVFGQVPSSEEPGHLSSRFPASQQRLSVSAGTIHLPSTPLPAGADSVRFHLQRVIVTGSTVYGEKRLSRLYASLIGTTVSLATIYGIAQSVTKLYGDDGYVLSRAIVPPQDIDPKHAVVTIEVSEAYVDSVVWPDSFKRYRDLFSGYAKKITAERPSNIRTVTRYLLLADELPGISVSSTFEASKTNPRASTLVVTATEKPVDLSASIDNHGTEARGPWEYVLSGTFNNLLGEHEALTATAAGSAQTKELTYLALSGKDVLTDEGLSVFSDLSYSWGSPGTAALEAIMFSSQSLSFDAGLLLPVIRDRDARLDLSALVFASNNEAQMLSAPSSDDRLRGIRLKAAYQYGDDSGGHLSIEGSLSHGFVALGSSQNGDPLLSREHGRVDFTTVSADAAYVHPLGRQFSVATSFSGQLAFTPLLSSEECGYGGKSFGRALDPSAITGDSCAMVSGELRYDPELPDSAMAKLELYGFADYGRVFRIAPSTGVPSQEDGASAGVGVRLSNDNFIADLAATKPLLGGPGSGWRAFFTLSARH